MSPRKPAVLRGGDGQDLRGYLIATAARLIDERGSAGLGVRKIAREAQVADGVLYNYFEDKEDLLAHALLAHVGAVMHAVAPRMPPAGTGSVADNLAMFIDSGMASLVRVAPAFAGLVSQPKVLIRFHAMVGGDPAFVGDAADEGDPAPGKGGTEAGGTTAEPSGDTEPGADTDPGGDTGPGEEAVAGEQRGLPDILGTYLRAEQRLGRIDADADVDAAVTLVVGVIHGEILPRVMFSPPGTRVSAPAGLSGRVAQTVLRGIARR
ncbi:MAG TPA: helix-turn-helix domain-containing protein [Streptosporangiaceae bacterium]|jgi:AcrR family transcriptional regulator|nr:helix-turn-helix domain-containing protein [Streptosporangiaceae bacterium]